MFLQTRSDLPPFATFRSIGALLLREMSTTYGRSPGGYAWAVLEPVGAIALLSLVFSYALRSPSLGTNFPLFYATGYLVFMMFQDPSMKVAQSINFSRQFLSYPRVTFIDALAARFLLAVITHLMVFYIVMTGIHIIYELNTIIDFMRIFETLLATAVLALAIGTLNCFFFTRFPVYRSAWSVLTRPLFILSCILFIPEDVPSELRGWLLLNPLVHLTGNMRAAFYATYDATYVSLVYVYLISGLALAFGLLLLRRYHRDLLER
ncbi:Polysialic acid transport protein KpsM [Jannaschia seosinensis]|uniref:Transport permease protein n=1 Tax=Jannaschia seosinensis TaxID=313367 RepID=A0A0M7BB17_9RHOB|nr:ABC transporter permease [Jannaschia seosinensis]CUH36803.1 Polysialic acid transport protein KpsM [Jannaschia seosinensis]